MIYHPNMFDTRHTKIKREWEQRKSCGANRGNGARRRQRWEGAKQIMDNNKKNDVLRS